MQKSNFIWNIKGFINDNRVLFVLICLLDLLVIHLGDKLVLTEKFYTDLMTRERYPNALIEGIKDYNLGVGWAVDAISPLILLIKFSLISGFIYFVTYLKEEEVISFRKIMKGVMLAEIIFIAAAIIKIIQLNQVATTMDVNHYMTFHPLSLINLIDKSVTHQHIWLIEPLKSINLFQVVYVLVLAYFLKEILEQQFKRIAGTVLLAYTIPFIFYISGFMFIGIMSS